MVIIVLGCILIVAGLLVKQLSNNPIPDYNQNIHLTQLTDEVQVYRDSFAIPHVFARNETDLYIAVGYLMAQDRLWQMDLLRRVTMGRLAEVLSDDLVDVDQLMRSLQMTKKSTEIYHQANPALKQCMEAFCTGVNQYIVDSQRSLPIEFKLLGYKPEPWKPVHSINLIGYMAWDLSTGWPNELTLFKINQAVNNEHFSFFLPDIPGQSTSIYPEFTLDNDEAEILTALHRVTQKIDELGLDVFRGSNNWAISGSKTKSGRPLLANDMHLGLNVPGIWYQMHQVVPGKLDVTGVVLPGQPFIVAGHNEKIAWGFTNVMTDDLDFYKETVNPENPDEYRLDGAWKKFNTKQETIFTKSGDTVLVENQYTHRGPVVAPIKAIEGKTFSMQWIGNLPSNELSTVYKLNRAQNWNDFREAIRTFVSVNQNVVYADVDGNIGLHSTIGLPIRNTSGVGVLPGDTTLYDWQGLVDFEELPYYFNPEDGLVSSANNRTVDSDYPYYISSWFDLPYRQDRIQELLRENKLLDVDDFIRIQADQQSKMAEKFTPIFLKELKSIQGPDDKYSEAVSYLENWDYKLSRESVATTIFEFLYFNLFEQLAADELGEELFEEVAGKKVMVKNFMENILRNTNNSWCDDVTTETSKEDWSAAVSSAFLESITEIEELMGAKLNKWEWGKIHRLTLNHPLSSAKLIASIFGLNEGPYPVGGSHHTVCPYSYDFMDPGSVDHGASHRHIYDLGNWDNSRTVIPTGNSGLPGSDHYCDQTRLYVYNEYHSDYISRKKIEETAKYNMTFTK